MLQFLFFVIINHTIGCWRIRIPILPPIQKRLVFFAKIWGNTIAASPNASSTIPIFQNVSSGSKCVPWLIIWWWIWSLDWYVHVINNDYAVRVNLVWFFVFVFSKVDLDVRLRWWRWWRCRWRRRRGIRWWTSFLSWRDMQTTFLTRTTCKRRIITFKKTGCWLISNPSFYFLRQCFHVSIYSISKFEPNTVYVNFLWRQTILIILMSSSITELPSKPRLVFIVQVWSFYFQLLGLL